MKETNSAVHYAHFKSFTLICICCCCRIMLSECKLFKSFYALLCFWLFRPCCYSISVLNDKSIDWINGNLNKLVFQQKYEILSKNWCMFLLCIRILTLNIKTQNFFLSKLLFLFVLTFYGLLIKHLSLVMNSAVV